MAVLTPSIAIDTRTGVAHISSIGPLQMVQYKPAAGPQATFNYANDRVLPWSWGRAIMPDASGSAGDAAAGFMLPVSVVKENARMLAAGKNVWRITVIRYASALPGTGTGANTPVYQNLHNTATDIGLDRLRFVTTTTPIEDAQIETTIQRKNGSSNAPSIVPHPVTRDELGLLGGCTVFYFTELIAQDSSAGNGPNINLTVWSVGSNGVDVYEPTVFSHFSSAPSPVYPLWGEADMPDATAQMYYGRAYGAGTQGTQGELMAVAMGYRTGAMLSDASEIRSAVDVVLRFSALPPGGRLRYRQRCSGGWF